MGWRGSQFDHLAIRLYLRRNVPRVDTTVMIVKERTILWSGDVSSMRVINWAESRAIGSGMPRFYRPLEAHQIKKLVHTFEPLQ